MISFSNNNQYFWIVTAKDLRNGGGVSDGRNTDQEKLFLPLETNFCFRNSIDILNFIDFFEEVIMNQAPFFSDEKQVGGHRKRIESRQTIHCQFGEVLCHQGCGVG